MLNEIAQELNSLEHTKRYIVWQPFMQNHNCRFICEVGVREGVNFKYMIQHNPSLAVAVDLWRDDGAIARNDKGFSQEELDRQFTTFEAEMQDKLFVRIHRDYSQNIAKKYPDNVFDLVYIDADHTYQGALADLQSWYPKVKPGGFLLGDDYLDATTRTGVTFGVIDAVKKFTTDQNLEFFTFGHYKWGLVKPLNHSEIPA